MRCHVCGCNAPTRYVEFYQNIGAGFMRFYKEIKGELCKRCINKFFFKFTLTTACIGWFGMISMIVTPIFIINNIIRFCGTIGMRTGDEVYRPPVDHPTLSLTSDVIKKIEPFGAQIVERLDKGEALDRVAMAVAPHAGVSALQLEMFVEKILKRPA